MSKTVREHQRRKIRIFLCIDFLNVSLFVSHSNEYNQSLRQWKTQEKEEYDKMNVCKEKEAKNVSINCMHFGLLLID